MDSLSPGQTGAALFTSTLCWGSVNMTVPCLSLSPVSPHLVWSGCCRQNKKYINGHKDILRQEQAAAAAAAHTPIHTQLSHDIMFGMP